MYLGEKNLQIPWGIASCPADDKARLCFEDNRRQNKIETELPQNSILSDKQRTLLMCLVDFSVVCYVPWWLIAPLSTSAPWNDLLLLNSLIKYGSHDSVIAYIIIGICPKNSSPWYSFPSCYT